MVTEYHHHAAATFAIEVVRFTREEMKAQLEGLLASYRHLHLNSARLTTESSPADREDAEMLAAVAQDTFAALYRGRHRDLSFLYRESEAMAKRKLESLISELFPYSATERVVFGTASECSEALLRLTSEPSAPREPALWPFYRVIK